MEWRQEGFRIIDDSAETSVEVVLRLLADTYWGRRRSRSIVEKLIQNSLCFSLFAGQEQIGFARVSTDYAVFSWLSDLVIADPYRGQGLGRWLIESVLTHPSLRGTQFVLQTENAHKFYEKFGFKGSDKLMTKMPAEK
jgi:GNAT superfamily N-acetyltransferase